MVSANYEAYKSVMRQAYRDGQITPEESAVLETLRQSLNITTDEHHQAESEVQQEIDIGGLPDGGSTAFSEPEAEPVPDYNDDNNVIRPGMNSDEFSNNPNPGPEFENSGGVAFATDTMEAPGGAPAAAEPQSLDDILNAGKGAYKKGDFQQAIGYFDKAIEIEPDNSEAIFYRKRSQKKLEEIGGAAAGKPAGAAAGTPSGMAAGVKVAVATPPPAPNLAGVKGDPNCSSCNGSGTCRWCKATGGCYWCKGTGQCDKCKGTGITKGQQCNACAGSGKCHSCKGTGHCYWCQGSGKCSKCVTS